MAFWRRSPQESDQDLLEDGGDEGGFLIPRSRSPGSSSTFSDQRYRSPPSFHPYHSSGFHSESRGDEGDEGDEEEAEDDIEELTKFVDQCCHDNYNVVKKDGVVYIGVWSDTEIQEKELEADFKYLKSIEFIKTDAKPVFVKRDECKYIYGENDYY